MASLRVMGSGVRPLMSLYRVIGEDAIVGGGVVCFCLLALLPFGDDDGAGILTDVDDVEQVIVGVVVRLSGVLLDALEDALAALGAFLVTEHAPFLLLVIVFFFHFDGDLDAWRG